MLWKSQVKQGKVLRQRANQSLAKQIKNFFEFVLFLKYYLLLIIYKCSNRSNFLNHKNCRYIFSMLNEIA